MHQPYYKNTETDKFILPWVRLHGVKDYYDMVSILDRYPSVKQNFNLVPSLLLQIEEYLAGTTDIFMDMTLKPAGELNEDERVFVLFNFFMANWNTMVYPYPRYAYLLKKRGENSHPDVVKKSHKTFTTAEIRDLQVWFNLAWIDPDFFQIYPDLMKLREKGENFTEEEKELVIKRHIDILGLILPKWKEAASAGRIEVSTTPFYHPILPLVYNTDYARRCMPGIELDFNFFHPEDAKEQVRRGLAYFAEKFGKRPDGMWPSEGSVSPEIIEIMAAEGVKWSATDEEILWESLKAGKGEALPGALYTPYTVNTGAGPVDMVFRNHSLSDLIGFTYQGWQPAEAAAHFVNELYNIKNSGGEKKAVSIILDGENAWECYANDGKDFLNELYSRLDSNSDFKCVTIGEMMKAFPEKPELKPLYTGSWINHDFYIWIGHEQDKKAWKLLAEARDYLVKWEAANPGEPERAKRAWEAVYIAEGSDWNWWYGDDHSSKNDTEFDNLYRQHLMNVYTITGGEAPIKFFEPIAVVEAGFDKEPSRLIAPVIDGEDTDFYEWKGAGVHELTKEGGAMHRAEKDVDTLYYGFSRDDLYIRLDAKGGFSKTLQDADVEVWFLEESKKEMLKFTGGGGVEASGMEKTGACCAAGKIFEAKIPFADVGRVMTGKSIRFRVVLKKGGKEAQEIPEKGFIHIKEPGKGFELYNWKV